MALHGNRIEDNMIKIDFEKTDGVNNFRDALWLEDDHTFTEVEIEAMKQARFDNWIAIINAPPPPEVEPILAECLIHPDYVEYDGVRYARTGV